MPKEKEYEIRFKSNVDGVAIVKATSPEAAEQKLYDDKLLYITEAAIFGNAEIEVPYAEVI